MQAASWMRPGPWAADWGTYRHSRQSRQLLPTHRGCGQPCTPMAQQLLSACKMTQPGSGWASRDFLTQLSRLQNWGGPTPPCNNIDTDTPCRGVQGVTPIPVTPRPPQEHPDTLQHWG